MTSEKRIDIQKKVLDAFTPIIVELRENGVLSAHLHIDDVTGVVDVSTWTKDDHAAAEPKPIDDIHFATDVVTKVGRKLFPLPATDDAGAAIDDALREELSGFFAAIGGLLMAMMANDFEGRTKLISVLMRAAGVQINKNPQGHQHPM